MGNMKIVKSHGWEGAFLERILRIRSQELGALRTSNLLFSMSLVSFQVSTFLVRSPWPLRTAQTKGGSARGGGGGDEVGGAPAPQILDPFQATPSLKCSSPGSFPLSGILALC